MIRLKYVVRDFEQMVDDWAKLLKKTPGQHFFLMPAIAGTGSLYARRINDMISFLVMNVTFNDDVVLEREPLDEVNLLLYFIQVNVAGHYQVVTDIDRVEYNGTLKRSSIFLSSTNYPLEISYSKGTRVRVIGIHFNSLLVRKFLKKDIFHHVTEYSQARLKNHDKKTIPEEEKKLLKEIFETDPGDEFGRLVLHNRILLLLEKSLNRFLMNELPPSKTRRLKDKDMDGLKEVEFILSERELKKFPSIEALSRIALMSSTKLKKRFKEVYGMKLYEFYNYNRLSKAKQSIESGKNSIKQAAYDTGFSNLSNFSKAFKKEFGTLPSQIGK